MQAKPTNFSFRAYAWRQFKKNKPAYVSFYILVVLIVIALLAPLIANDKPLYIKYQGETFFPAFSFKNKYEVWNKTDNEKEILQLDITDWKQLDYEEAIWAPIPYSPGKSDLLNAYYVGPSDKQLFRNSKGEIVDMPKRFRHLLGTSVRGEDVFAGLIHGTRISLTIGILSMGVATLIGLFLGAFAGYFGDNGLKTTRGVFWTMILGVIIAFHYGFIVRNFALSDALATSVLALLKEFFLTLLLFTFILAIFYFIGRLIAKLPFFNQQVNIPVDSIISRSIEILISLPTLILIISIAAIARPSMFNLIMIIGLTSWTGIARFTRAEFLRIKNLEYIQAGKALGYSEFRIIAKHALPNGIAPALIAIAFGIASAVLVESGLSFLGIGIPPETVTWGALLSEGKKQFSAWWLVVFPGLAIFLTVTVYNLLGEGLRDALDPRLKK